MPRRRGLRGGFPLQYQGVEAPNPPNITVNSSRAPTTADSIGYNIGDLWLQYRPGFPNTGSHDDIYMLVGLERDVAHWVNFLDSSGLDTLTGNIGGAISPDAADNIDVLGDTTVGLTTTGVPASNSITITTVSGNPIGTDYITDNGTAFPNAAGEIHINTDQASRICGNTVLFSGAANIVSLTVTDAGGNTTIGEDAGSIAITTGQNNTGLGDSVLRNFIGGSQNSALGVGACNAITNGNENTGIGYLALAVCTFGDGNVALGNNSLPSLVTGNGNVVIGNNSGLNYTGGETANILLFDTGTTGDNNTIRIGTQGTQTSAYCAGITGVTVSNQVDVVIDSTTGQLGVGSANTSIGFMADLSAAVDNVTGIADSYQIIFDREYFDLGSNYNNATGFFTAPSAGLYNFSTTVTMDNIDSTQHGSILWFVVAGTGPSVGPWSFMRDNPFVTKSTIPQEQWWRNNGAITVLLDSGDTVTVVVSFIAGNTKNVTVGTGTGGPPTRTWFCGHRI